MQYPDPILTVLLNIGFWLAISMLSAFAGTRFRHGSFHTGAFIYKERRWERQGRFYEEDLMVRKWKDLLPDWGGIFRGGFSKGALRSSSGDYLKRFAEETCRGEIVHWAAMLTGPVTLLWNPLWGAAVMTAYGVLANLPCIIVQRYNRIRILKLLDERGKS